MEMTIWQFLAIWFVIFIIYSFGGWVIEVLVTIINHKKLVNRGFLIGPVCPIYGVGALLLSLICSCSDGVIEIFCVSMIGSALLEYLTSWWMEMAFHVRWWDYSEQPFNLNGRICVGSVLRFGLAGVLILKVINPFLLWLVGLLPILAVEIIALALLIIMLADIAVSTYLIIAYKVTVDTAGRDATEEISERIREILRGKSKLQQHHYKAFPGQAPSKRSAKQKK